MFRILSLLLCLACFLGLCPGVQAAQIACDSTYCFSEQDFATGQEALRGVCITGLPDPDAGTVMLNTRILQKGDILAADQLSRLTFLPLLTQQDIQAQVRYLPIYEDRVEKTAVLTLSVLGKKDLPPEASDSTIETYKNLPNQGRLEVFDPEGEPLTFSVLRQPRRGQVELRSDGTFLYTPKKNKVGVDSFVYTATDPAGNVSRQATVTIQILKPTDARQYQDTADSGYRFEAEWLRNAGLFTGETISGQFCFQPEKAVSRGEFLAMLVQALEVPADAEGLSSLPADTPTWLKPYLAAALRAGLTEGLPSQESGSFCDQEPVTGAQAAVMLQNILDLGLSSQLLETVSQDPSVPAWAAASVAVMNAHHMDLRWDQPLTRGQVARILYRACTLAVTAPGTAVFRMLG